jgi:tRNA threonylcarbamoyladenosine biosynthesis protein TsaB
LYTIALETSGTPGSVALLQDETVVCQSILPREPRMARTFAPQIQQALQEVGWSPRQVDLFAASEGPGSFTGLRIAVTAAKVFAYATGCDILGINTLEVMAVQAPRDGRRTWATLDAQRGQLYAQAFHWTAGQLQKQTEPQIWDLDTWINELRAGDVATGTGLARYQTRLPPTVRLADPAQWTPRAATLGQLAVVRFRAGERQDLWSLVPRYYRASAAEEKWAEGTIRR